MVISLASANKDRPDSRLQRWWSEVDCDSWCGDIVQPDARLIWTEGDRSVEALLEYDRGTEPHHRLLTKLDGYARLEQDRGVSCWVLLAFTSARREAAVRRTLHTHAVDVPVATTSVTPTAAPAEPLWRPLAGDPAVRLIDLLTVPRPTAALARARQADREWKYREVITGKETFIGPFIAD